MLAFLAAFAASALSAATVEGIVRNSHTGNPVASAEVCLFRTTRPPNTPIRPYIYGGEIDSKSCQAFQQTDKSGRFVFTGIEAGTYELSAAADGFSSILLIQQSRYRVDLPFALEAGSAVQGFDIALEPEALIKGKVRGATPGTVVIAQGKSGRSDWTESEPVGQDGEYELADLWEGEYRLAVFPRYDRLPQPGEDTMQGLQPAFSGPHTLGVGAQGKWSPKLGTGPLHRASFRVDLPGEGNHIGCRLIAEIRHDWEHPFSTTPCSFGNGVLRLPWLPNGSYRLEAEHQGTFGWTRFQIRGTDVEAVRLRLLHTATVRLRFRLNGKPLLKQEAIHPALVPKPDLVTATSRQWTDEYFECTGLPAEAEYDIAPDYWSREYDVAAIRTTSPGATFEAGGKLVLRDPPGPVEIVVDLRPKTVIRIKDEPDLRELRAVIVYEDPLGGGMKLAMDRRGPDGEWSIRGVPPGNHRLYTGNDPCPEDTPQSCEGLGKEIRVPATGAFVIPRAVLTEK